MGLVQFPQCHGDTLINIPTRQNATKCVLRSIHNFFGLKNFFAPSPHSQQILFSAIPSMHPILISNTYLFLLPTNYIQHSKMNVCVTFRFLVLPYFLCLDPSLSFSPSNQPPLKPPKASPFYLAPTLFLVPAIDELHMLICYVSPYPSTSKKLNSQRAK